MTPSEKYLSWLERLPAPVVNALTCALSVLAGAAVAMMFYYLLYRLGLPSQPFIYVAF